MADTIDGGENAAFWLPTHFLTDDDDFLAGPEDHHRRRTSFNTEPPPTPWNFDSFSSNSLFDPFGPHSSFDSPVRSTDTDKGENHQNDEDELLFAELTRKLARSLLSEFHHHPNLTEPWIFSTSPQSTLTGFGSGLSRSGFTSNGSPNGPSQIPSPPLTPPGGKNDAAWELLYEAAGQIARLKVNAVAQQKMNCHHHHYHHQQSRGLLRHHPINGSYDVVQTNQPVKKQGSTMWVRGMEEREDWYSQHHHSQRRCCGGCNGGALGLPHSAWPPLRAAQPHHNHRDHGGPGMRAMFLGSRSESGSISGSGIKRQSAGTGVFLPRRIGTQSEQEPPRKKQPGCSTVLLPERVVQFLNLDLEEINNGVNCNPQLQLDTGFSYHDVMMARNALLGHHRRSSRSEGATTMAGHEFRLPSDWTY